MEYLQCHSCAWFLRFPHPTMHGFQTSWLEPSSEPMHSCTGPMPRAHLWVNWTTSSPNYLTPDRTREILVYQLLKIPLFVIKYIHLCTLEITYNIKVSYIKNANSSMFRTIPTGIHIPVVSLRHVFVDIDFEIRGFSENCTFKETEIHGLRDPINTICN